VNGKVQLGVDHDEITDGVDGGGGGSLFVHPLVAMSGYLVLMLRHR
jgi:hypothetical protein